MQIKHFDIPGLKLFGTQRMGDVFNRVTQTVCVVIGRVNTPEKEDKPKS